MFREPALLYVADHRTRFADGEKPVMGTATYRADIGRTGRARQIRWTGVEPADEGLARMTRKASFIFRPAMADGEPAQVRDHSFEWAFNYVPSMCDMPEQCVGAKRP